STLVAGHSPEGISADTGKLIVVGLVVLSLVGLLIIALIRYGPSVLHYLATFKLKNPNTHDILIDLFETEVNAYQHDKVEKRDERLQGIFLAADRVLKNYLLMTKAQQKRFLEISGRIE